jgi:hypothetical protein
MIIYRVGHCLVVVAKFDQRFKTRNELKLIRKSMNGTGDWAGPYISIFRGRHALTHLSWLLLAADAVL